MSKIQKGKVHITNEELSGSSIVIEHVEGNKFRGKLVVPQHVHDRVDFNGEEFKKDPEQFTGESILGALMRMLQGLALEERCVEIENVDGKVTDVSGSSTLSMLKDIATGALKEQYEKERASGVLPNSMSFDDWVEAQGLSDAGDLSETRTLN